MHFDNRIINMMKFIVIAPTTDSIQKSIAYF